jgi:hypothetical protein
MLGLYILYFHRIVIPHFAVGRQFAKPSDDDEVLLASGWLVGALGVTMRSLFCPLAAMPENRLEQHVDPSRKDWGKLGRRRVMGW